jgi:capsular polysaccharide transport system permease protein
MRFDAAAITPAADAGWNGGIGEDEEEGGPGRGGRLRRLARKHPFLLAVVLPTLLAAVYLFGVAADQYVSEARFVVRGRAQASSAASPLGTLLGTAGLAPAHEEAQAVRDYLSTHGAVLGLRGRIDLVALFTRPEADILARLWWTDPERLTRYFTSMVTTTYDSVSGMVAVRARSFRPEDSHALAEELLMLAEQLVNRMSERAREEALQTARKEVAVAERRVVVAREALTAFRGAQRSMDL